MSEEIKNWCESPQENQSETEDNRLPYESPKLRKHGKVSNTTQSSPIPLATFDSIFGPFRSDLS